MSLSDLIKQRRSVFQFKDKVVPSDWIMQFIEAAIYAPNHKLTEPWRFLVLGRQTQAALSIIYAEKRASKRHDIDSKGYRQAFEKSINKLMSIPQIILVAQVIDDDPVVRKEDYAACSCAIQNFQLAAWEQGIGVKWSTAPILKDERTFELLSLDLTNHELIAALYMGFPQAIGQTQRKPVEAVTRFFD